MIKPEIRKLLSVRSTYVVSLLVLLLVVLFSWLYVRDLKTSLSYQVENRPNSSVSVATGEQGPENTSNAEPSELSGEDLDQFEEYKSSRMREVVTNTISFAATFAVIIVILQIVHEYRWNMIMHTLTASRSRTKVFLSKIIVLLGFAITLALLAVIVGLTTYTVSVSAYDITMPAQTMDWGSLILRGSLYTVTFVSFGMIIAFLSRNIALAVAGFLIFPSTVEPLLGLWLKHNAIYLPFSATSHIILFNKQNPPESLDFRHALTTTLIYLAILYPVTWYLFLKRDAN